MLFNIKGRVNAFRYKAKQVHGTALIMVLINLRCQCTKFVFVGLKLNLIFIYQQEVW